MTTILFSFASLSESADLFGGLFTGIRIEVCDVFSLITRKRKKRTREEKREVATGKLERVIRAPLRLTAAANRFLNILLAFDTRYFATTWYVDETCVDIFAHAGTARETQPSCNS